jgi:hypothetical protein
MSLVGIETTTVVPDRTTQHKIFSPSTNPDIARPRMLDGIG